MDLRTLLFVAKRSQTVVVFVVSQFSASVALTKRFDCLGLAGVVAPVSIAHAVYEEQDESDQEQRPSPSNRNASRALRSRRTD